MTPDMVGRNIATGGTLMIALLAFTGLAAAQPLALVTGDGGGQAEGQAYGDYHADASGALDEAREQHADLKEKAHADARSTNRAVEEAKWAAYEETKVQRPQAPECPCDQIADELDQRGTMRASHADKVEKAANLESEYVDAGADVGASGQAQAWFQDVFHGASDLFDEARDRMGFETDADQDARAVAEQALTSEGELRGEIVENLPETELPDANPRVDGEFAAEHASEATSSAVGDAQADLP